MEGALNFYKRYPADYGRKTARLTLAQHGAYTLLLDELYTTEAGLPAESDELYRICRAMNKAEQEAVRFVADRFFPIGGDGLRHNDRASEELEAAAPAIEAARVNGKKGGRPKKETQQKPSGFSEQNPGATQTEPRTKAPQISDNSPSLRSGEDRASRLPADWLPDEELRQWAIAERPDLSIDKVLEKFRDYWSGVSGKAGRKLDWPATFRNWVRDERAPVAPRNQAPTPTGETAYQRNRREFMQQAVPSIAARVPGDSFNVIEMETVNVAPRALGR